MYNDPSYDEDGYELTERAIHRDTARNREGLTRAEIQARRKAAQDAAQEAEWDKQLLEAENGLDDEQRLEIERERVRDALQPQWGGPDPDSQPEQHNQDVPWTEVDIEGGAWNDTTDSNR